MSSLAKLDIRPPRLHADLAQHRQRGVTHDLIFLIGQRLSGRDRDGVASVNTHCVKIFDRADNDAVVVFVPDNLHLIFFPTDQRLINQQLAGG